MAKSTEILSSFGKPGHRATQTGDDDFYRLVDSLLADFESVVKWFRAEMMPGSHNNFFESAAFGLSCGKTDYGRKLPIPDLYSRVSLPSLNATFNVVFLKVTEVLTQFVWR